MCRAVEKLPDVEQERFSEEWRAHLDEVPGDLGKLLTALGFQYAAWKMRDAALSVPPISARLVIIPLLVPVLWNLYTTFRGLADFFDLPTYPSSGGQWAFGIGGTIFVIGFVVASRMIWRFASEDAPVLLLKAACVFCIVINIGASWIGTKRIVLFEADDPARTIALALVVALVILSTVGLSTLFFDKHNKPSSS